jgi:hypothetical protein
MTCVDHLCTFCFQGLLGKDGPFAGVFSKGRPFADGGPGASKVFSWAFCSDMTENGGGLLGPALPCEKTLRHYFIHRCLYTWHGEWPLSGSCGLFVGHFNTNHRSLFKYLSDMVDSIENIRRWVSFEKLFVIIKWKSQWIIYVNSYPLRISQYYYMNNLCVMSLTLSSSNN